MELGKRIRELRTKRGIEQLELASKVGISQSKMNKIETGFQKRIEPEILSEIANALNVSTDCILGRENIKVNVAGEEIELSPEEYKVFNELKKHSVAFNDLQTNPEKKIKQLIKMWEVLKSQLEDLEKGE